MRVERQNEGNSMQSKLWAGVCAAAICVAFHGQAMADPSATLGASYTDGQINSLTSRLHDWNINGSVAAPVVAAWTVQGDGAYDNLTGPSGIGRVHEGTVSGSAFWSAAKGRIGASVGYNNFGTDHSSSVNWASYSAFGLYYPTDRITLGLRGGGVSGSGVSGGFVGVRAIGYATPDLALNADVDAITVAHRTIRRYGVGGEYLMSETVPVSLTLGYTYADLGVASIHLNKYMVGLKVYFGGKTSSLVDRQRSGVETWGTKPVSPISVF
jgi:hypothetical protein